MIPARVLFVCGHNSGRSQMAEAFFKDIASRHTQVESAGLDPRPINPLVVEVMHELGFDLSRARSDNVFDFFKEGRLYNSVITVCDDTTDAQCPVFPGITDRIHWSFLDPEQLTGTRQEQLTALREIRDQIQKQVANWYKQFLD